MSSNVALEVVIQDDEINPPEMHKIGRKLIVKVPKLADYQTLINKIAEQCPILKEGALILYYFDSDGKCYHNPHLQRLLSSHPKSPESKSTISLYLLPGLRWAIPRRKVAKFWRHQQQISEGLCVLYISTIYMKYPHKNCDSCGGGLFGGYRACCCGRSHLCRTCFEDATNKCNEHGRQYFRTQIVKVPKHIVEQKCLEYLT